MLFTHFISPLKQDAASRALTISLAPSHLRKKEEASLYGRKEKISNLLQATGERLKQWMEQGLSSSVNWIFTSKINREQFTRSYVREGYRSRTFPSFLPMVALPSGARWTSFLICDTTTTMKVVWLHQNELIQIFGLFFSQGKRKLSIKKAGKSDPKFKWQGPKSAS